MNTAPMSFTEHDRMVDAAKRRAAQLRSEAIDELWRGAGDSAGKALRSARRFAASLARHSRNRDQVEA